MGRGLGEAMRRTRDSETQTHGRPCTTARSPERLTSEVGDVMMSEHGGRAWVLGQGQAATGTNTHSTSCGQQRTSQSRPCARGKIFLGPALPGTFVLPLSRNAHLSEAPEGAPLSTLWASLPRVPSEEALPSGVRVAAPPGLLGGSCWPLSPAHCPT